MLKSTPSAYQLKPPISAHLISALLALTGVLLSFFAGSVEQVVQIAPISFGLFLMAIAGWLITSRWNTAGAWFLVISTVISVIVVKEGLQLQGLEILLAIPPVLAAVTIGGKGLLLASGVETVYLIFLLIRGPMPLEAIQYGWITLVIWCETAAIGSIFQASNQVLSWTWEQYQQAHTTLEEAREQRSLAQQAIENLEVANRQLALMNDKISQFRLIAEEAEKTKANFVANVSHEFRTPLNMIIGLVDLMLVKPEIYGGPLPAQLRKDIETVQRSCEHLSALINDVLDLSRIEAGRLALRKERVSLAEIMERAIQVVMPLIEKKGLSIDLDIAPELPQVYCDRTRIRQVVVNLLSNAARATEQGGIQASVQTMDQDVLVSIQDTGPGIDPVQAARLFEPFYQGEPGRSGNKGGSGLGLSISKEFIELHQGKIWFESHPGKGSNFSFRLPIDPPVNPAEPPERWIIADWDWRKHPVSSNPSNLPLIPRIIICDETGDLFGTINRYADVFEPVATRTLKEAVIEAERKSALALVINTSLPLTLYEQVERARQALPDLPIIGCALPPRIQHPQSSSVLEYLLKPVTQVELETVLKRLDSKRILLVEDDPGAQELFARMIQAHDDAIEIHVLSNGMEALIALRELQPDLLLLDVVLPDIDGWQLIGLKNEEPGIKDIPVVMISAQNPMDSPIESRVIMTSLGSGLSIGKILRCIQVLPPLLLQPD